EGGGNTFSLDIDSKGRVFCGTNGGNTRGWYLPQGSYSRKNWGKHGPLTNPYAFGFFEAMQFKGDGRRFPQAFQIYEGGLFPKQDFDGAIIAPNAMQNLVWHSDRIPQGSTYRTEDRENLLECSDRWFRPVYSGVGPDGGIYIADWYDTRLSHVSPTDDWHKESGRVYRLRPEDSAPRYEFGDLHKKSDEELLSLLSRPNKWIRQRCSLELGWRQSNDATTEKLQKLVSEGSSLEALWALSQQGGLTSELAAEWLEHEDADIRRWVVRLLGDRHESHAGLAKLAGRESNHQVRSQLAASVRRIAPDAGLRIVSNLLQSADDSEDIQLPLMLWWAVESHAEAWPAMQDFASNLEIWKSPVFQSTIASRLMRRYAATGSKADLEKCSKLVELAPDTSSKQALIEGLNQAFQGRRLPKMPENLDATLKQYIASRGDSGLALAVAQGDPDAMKPALEKLNSTSSDLGLRIEMAKALGQAAHAPAQSVLLNLATARGTNSPALQRVAIQALT
ncbi:MAG: dehydrogenase, partial [Planctomycetota bacterium]